MHSRTITTPGPHRDVQPPGISLPPGSCDAHVHVFGPHERFPYAPERTFTPEDVPLEDLQHLHRVLGFDRSVLVQSACHGSDHRVLLDALERGEGRYKAVALLGAETTPADIKLWDAAGFCGVRIHFAPHLGAPPTADEINRIVALIGPYNWHLEVHVMGSGIFEFEKLYPQIPLRIVLDHMGRFDITPGRDQPEFRVVQDLLAAEDVWIKLSGADRVARRPPVLTDAWELARTLFRTRPDRCVWGTDFPHPNTHGFMPRDADLVNGLAHITDNDEELRQLLVTNPEQCFGFAPSSGR